MLGPCRSAGVAARAAGAGLVAPARTMGTSAPAGTRARVAARAPSKPWHNSCSRSA